MITWNTIANMPLQPLIQRIGWTLVHSIWEGLAIAALLSIALRLLRNATATKRYAACALALLATVCAIVVAFIVCADPALAPEARSSLIPIASPENVSALPALAIAPAISTPVPSQKTIILQTIVLLWTLGVMVMTIRHVGGWLWLRRLRQGKPLDRYQPAMEHLAHRLGITRIVRLIETSRLDVPAVIGVLRPIILIPVGVLNDLTPRQIEAILAHELAHIRRHDYLVNLLQAVIETLLFYHPAVWWMSNRMRAERENCCDDIAADLCGDKRLYAAALTALEHRRGSPLAAVALTGGDLLTRIRRLLKLPPTAPAGYARPLVIAVLALLCVAIPATCFVLMKMHDQPTKFAAGRAASSNPHDAKSEINILIGPQSMLANGMPVDWPQLEAMLVALPQPQRSKTILALAASTGDVTVNRYFEASNHLAELVKKYGLAYVSQTGIKPPPKPSTAASSDDPLEHLSPITPADLAPHAEDATVEQSKHTYSILGKVNRPGQYQIVTPDYRVRDALASAGAISDSTAQLFVIRKSDQRNMEIPLQPLAAEDKSVNVVIRPDDTIIAVPAPATAPSPPATIQLDPNLSVESIAAIDTTMREYLKQKDAFSFRVAKLSRNVGPGNRMLIDAQEDLSIQQQRIDEYAVEFRKHFSGIYRDGATVIPLTRDMESQLNARQNPSPRAPATTQSDDVRPPRNTAVFVPANATQPTATFSPAAKRLPDFDAAKFMQSSATQPSREKRFDLGAVPPSVTLFNQSGFTSTGFGYVPSFIAPNGLPYNNTNPRTDGGWVITAGPRYKGSEPPIGNATAQVPPYRVLIITIDKTTMTCDGKPIDFDGLGSMLHQLDAAHRRRTAIAIQPIPPDITVARYFEVTRGLKAFVTEYDLADYREDGPALQNKSSATQPTGRNHDPVNANTTALQNAVQLKLLQNERASIDARDRVLATRLGSEHPDRHKNQAMLKQLDIEIQKLSPAATTNPASATNAALTPDLLVLLQQQANLQVAIMSLADLGSENRLVINYEAALERVSKKIETFNSP